MSLHFNETFHLDLGPAWPKLTDAQAAVKAASDHGDLGFMKLPHADISAVHELAQAVAGEFKDVVVIGIGGSDLGTRAIFRAIKGSMYNLSEAVRAGRPRLFFTGDTTDPVALTEVIEVVDWSSTVLIMVSKSGNTVEQMSTFVYLREKLIQSVGEEQAKRAIISITDGEKGTMREITNREGYRNLIIPADVGGRFSVLTPVGLLPLAIVGVDINELLHGAADMTLDNEAPAKYALMQYLALTERQQPIHVVMPYSYNLREVGFWFRQLWAESLGKAVSRSGEEVHTGPTPIASVGPTDQHSQVQLYREGPNDKTFTFITVREPAVNMTLPEAFSDLEGVRYLAGHNFNEILLAEQKSTEAALQEVGRPTCTIELDRLDEYHVGQLLFFFELATAYAGELFNVNAYDQPGVERGKQLMYELLGR